MNELTPIPQLKTEIQFYERQTATGMLEIGKRLIQIKGQLPHGEFGAWCETELSYTDRTARNFMQCYAEYGNRQLISDLNSTQMIAMLGLPEEQKQGIVQNNDMSEMTVRKLQDEVKALKDKTRQYEEGNKNLTDQRDNLEHQLQNAKPEVVVKEVIKEVDKIPDDYNNLKRQAEFYRKASSESSKAYEKILSENMALRQQNSDRKRNYNNLDPMVFAQSLKNFLIDMKRYEAMGDDFENLEDKDEQTITKGIDAVINQMTSLKYFIKNLEVIEIE